MKKIILCALGALTLGAVTSCDSFLDDNRYPLTSIVNNPQYWSNPSNCQLQVDRYLDCISLGYGYSGYYGWFYFKTLSDDQVGSSFANWDFTSVPGTNGNWTFSQVRGANYIIEGVRSAQSSLGVSNYHNYEGIARLIRAAAYYHLVRTFGDVTWEGKVVDVNDKEILDGPRTDRDIVMDSVFRDLDYAIATIATESAKVSWSRDLALAVKCEVALYEGTFCKYRNEKENGKAANQERAKKYLQEAADAAQILMSKYGFTDDYQSIYNSTWAGGDGITAFTANPEIIFGRQYDAVNGRHSTISYTCSSTTTSGMSLDAFKSFLFLDGKPAASTRYNTSLVGTPTTYDDKPALSIEEQLSVRDKRLSIMTDPYVYYMGMTWSRAGATGMNSSSGFGVAKFDNVLLPVTDRQNSANNYTSCPIYWTSYIYCNYAEAKAELGTLTDADLNATLNKLYTRAGLPTQTVASLSAINDPANNMGVSSLLWEVRRCRRCELMFDNWIRYWDLIRWHQLELLDSKKHPDVLRGAYVANSPVAPTAGYADSEGYYRSYDAERTYEYKYYLQPIPSGELNLNENLGQNPGWGMSGN